MEGLLRQRTEVRRIKAGGRSARNVHAENRTTENFQANMGILQMFVPDETAQEYQIENIHLIRLPVSEPLESGLLTIRLD